MLFETMFTPCKRSGARYRSKWYIDDIDGALLFGLGVHGQYLFVDAEKLVVANVSSGELPLDAAHNSPPLTLSRPKIVAGSLYPPLTLTD